MPAANIDFVALLPLLAKHLFGDPNPAFSSKDEWRYGNKGSLSFDLIKGTWYDHEAREGGGVLDLVAREQKLQGKDATDWLKREGLLNGKAKPNDAARPTTKSKSSKFNIVKPYPYRDENGELLFEVCRLDPKDFRQRKPNGKGWIWSVEGVRRVPYKLPGLLEAGDRVVCIPEGEKDVDRLLELGVPATTNAGGANKFHSDLIPFFKGCDVVIVPDNDKAGRDHAADVAAKLHGVAKRVRVLELWRDWPSMPDKADISEWLDNGGTVERLYKLIEKLPDWKPVQAQLTRTETPEWRERRVNGSPIPSMHNARLAITAIGVECSYDTFHDKMLFGYEDDAAHHTLEPIIGEVSDNGIMGLRRLLSDRFGFDLTEKHVRDAVVSLALEHCFNPVADMLDKAEAEWDRKPVERLDRMAADHLNCEDTPLNAACVRKTMIAAVARVRQPGIKFDTIPVFESPEGLNKSTAWQVLAGEGNFSDEPIIGKNSREVQEQLASVWIHENADLAGMKKAEVEQVKAFASRTEDRARAAYGHFLKRQPRHSIEVATTNNDEYLQSQTGNRRFWPMRVIKTIDLQKLKEDRLKLWGEAAHYQSNGECLTIDEAMWPVAGIEQEKRRAKDPWEDVLRKMPDVIEVPKWSEDAKGNRSATTTTITIINIIDGQERVASDVILEHILKVPSANLTTAHSMKLSNAMRAIGWKRDPDGNKITIGGKQVRGYFREITDQPA